MLIFLAILWSNLFLVFPMHLSDEVITWRCAASGEKRSYLVETLDRTLSSFDLIVYSSQDFQDITYLQTLTIDIIKNDNQGLYAQSRYDSPLVIIAFKDGLRFEVNDPLGPLAIGRCERNIEFN